MKWYRGVNEILKDYPDLPYRTPYALYKAIQSGELKAVVRHQDKGPGRRYLIPEVAVQEYMKRIMAPFKEQ